MLKLTTPRRVAALMVASAATASLAAAPAEAAKTVTTRGGDEFKPNEYVRSSHRFAPGRIVVRPNERVTWVDRDFTRDPHTITVLTRRNVPNTLGELFNCQACALAFAHLENPNDPNSPLARERVNVGKAGMNTQGDSLYMRNRGRVSARITAGVGRTLHYLCGIHPWMQGTIRVTRTGTRPQAAAGVGGGGAGLAGRTR